MNMNNGLKLIIMALAVAALAIAGPLAAFAENHNTAQAEPGDIQLDDELEALLAGTAEKKVYKFPVIRPEYALELGYAFSDFRNSPTAGRYVHHKKSPILGLDIKTFFFPNRFSAEMEGISDRDYFGDIRYAYGDTVLFRWVGVGLYKNPERFMPLTTDNGYNVTDRDETYGVLTSINHGTLRFKTPDFPAHLYFKYWHVGKAGWVQEQHLGGSGYYDNLEIVTGKRRVDWRAEDYHMGGNTHMGYVELQYAHSNTSVEPENGTQHSYYNYTTSSFRGAGLWPHNDMPEFHGSNDTFQIHTTYTGKLVASASFSNKKYENSSGGAKSQYLVGASSLTWMPMTSTTFFMKYKYTRIDNDTPNQSTISDQTGALSKTYGVKQALNSTANDASISGRFRLADWAVLRAHLKYDQILRDNAEDWGLENKETKTKTGGFSLNIKPAEALSLHGDYYYSDMEAQAYNTDYDSSHRVNLGADWIATDWMSVMLYYTARGEDRDNLLYSSTEGAHDRRIFRDSSMLSVGMAASERTHITVTVNQLLNSNRQDIIYLDDSNVATVSPGVLYEDVATSYSLSMNYLANEKVSLGGGLTHTRAEGRLQTSNLALTLPVSIEDMTDMNYKETTLDAYSDIRLGGGFSMKVEYEFTKLDDRIENTYDSIEDGKSHLAKISFKKKW